MNEKNDPVAFLLGLADGRWQGEEEIVVDPSAEPMAFTGKLNNERTLGDTALAGSYTQSRDGETTMRCHTVIRLTADGEAVMTWVPSEGEPQIFRGRFNGPVLEVSRSDDDGARHTITEDFGDGKTMTNVMTVTPPGGEPMTVFTGRYTKLGPVAGREAWRDLAIPDAAGARPFYEAVLGWTSQPVDMGGYDDYNMLDAEGEVAGGVCHARGGNADLPPVWLLYFTVPSLEKAIAAAEANGGRVVAGPKGFGGFSYAVLADPAGAQFIACEQKV
ncbi:VOC family protein [Lentisalinibacter sediminis]|uniref:VOC family protein n=1 Tax=Lentisalinibacter sediminis TaxID=2992237 RepID=UPI00386AAD76